MPEKTPVTSPKVEPAPVNPTATTAAVQIGTMIENPVKVTNVSAQPIHVEEFFLVPSVPITIRKELLTENRMLKHYMDQKMVLEGEHVVVPEVPQDESK